MERLVADADLSTGLDGPRADNDDVVGGVVGPGEHVRITGVVQPGFVGPNHVSLVLDQVSDFQDQRYHSNTFDIVYDWGLLYGMIYSWSRSVSFQDHKCRRCISQLPDCLVH